MHDSQDQAEQRAQAAQHQADDEQYEHEPGAWAQDEGELPRRPRLRLLAPLPVALLLGLALAGGFIAGVLVEKGQGEPASGGSGALASRLTGLRSSGGRGLAALASSGSGSTSGSGAGTGLPSFRGAGGASATVGQVAFVKAGTLYVTTGEGNTVKVTTAPGASVTKTVQASVGKIHPGETVLVTGSTHANGSIAASSIRVGGVGAAFGGGLIGSGGGSASGTGTSAGSSSAAGSGAAGASGGPALFGNGG
ncbi:MAG TPA: hypothetical protein VGF47_05390 [Solirubrobacteraceae bacterium]|jgi:hypothetical protein